MLTSLAFAIVFLLFIFLSFISMIRRYRRCPSDKILVIFGRTGEGSAKCIHGGAAFVWPLFQDYSYLDLTPISIEIPLQGALSRENIRIAAPSTFTVGISTEPAVMKNAAERLLELNQSDVRKVAEDIIFGQFRATIATMNIEEINKDREKFQSSVMESVEVELAKVGLRVINVNIKDIDDESGYIKALGQKAASEAVNQAKIDVAEQERKGQIGVAEADKEKEIGVANAAKDREIGVAGADKDREIGLASAAKDREIGIAGANRDKEIGIAGADKEKEIGLAEAAKEREIGIARAEKEREIAMADALREQRIGVSAADAQAVKGENLARQVKADSDAELREKMAEANRRGTVAEKTKEAEAKRIAYQAEMEAELGRAERDKASRVADAIPLAEAEKQRVIIAAEAEMERQAREGRGEGERVKNEMLGRAEGMKAVFDANAEGIKKLVAAASGDANAAFMLMMADRLPELMNIQATAISNFKVDKVTVWDSGARDGKAISNLVKDYATSLPPLQDLLNMTGVVGPGLLGTGKPETERPRDSSGDSSV
jgi:flotillin